MLIDSLFFLGMGEKITRRLLELGAHVYGIDKTTVAGKQPPNVEHILCDVSNWKEAYRCISDIGPVHGLVNNAGVAVIEPFFDVTEYGWDR